MVSKAKPAISARQFQKLNPDLFPPTVKKKLISARKAKSLEKQIRKVYDTSSRTPSGRHKTKMVCINGERRPIDKDIAPLIDALNKLGIHTTRSCQADCYHHCDMKHKHLGIHVKYDEQFGRYMMNWYNKTPKKCQESVSILFKTVNDGDKFLNTVYRDTDLQKLKDHMVYGGKKNSHGWVWKTVIDNVNDWTWMNSKGKTCGEFVGPPKFRSYKVVVFPRAHLKLVTDRVLEKLNGSK